MNSSKMSSNFGKSISLILPTYNEGKNLELLIPAFMSAFGDFPGIEHFELIVVDDGSTDGTSEVAKKYLQKFQNLKFIFRKATPSLPLSIQDGIYEAGNDLVIWIDADGSMPVAEVKKLWVEFNPLNDDAVIGSRFVPGGGFKGITPEKKTSFFEFLNNIKRSEDSILAVILSRLLNYFLRFLLNVGIRDLTSGFIVVKRSVLKNFRLSGNYGDYFPKLMWEFHKSNFRVREIGYYCVPRIHGESKTGTSLPKLLRNGIPYLQVATKCRIGSTLKFFQKVQR